MRMKGGEVPLELGQLSVCLPDTAPGVTLARTRKPLFAAHEISPAAPAPPASARRRRPPWGMPSTMRDGAQCTAEYCRRSLSLTAKGDHSTLEIRPVRPEESPASGLSCTRRRPG